MFGENWWRDVIASEWVDNCNIDIAIEVHLKIINDSLHCDPDLCGRIIAQVNVQVYTGR